jgi:hypothetical protein
MISKETADRFLAGPALALVGASRSSPSSEISL